MRYTLSEEERRRRRAETAAMTKCPCGNVAGLHKTLCGRCVRAQDQAQEALDEHRRMRELLMVIRDIYSDPTYRFDATADAIQMIWENIA